MPKDAPEAAASPPEVLFAPQVRLDGPVDDQMFRAFRDAFAQAVAAGGPVAVELTTLGGDADVGRRIADEVRLFRERTGRRPVFFGRSIVYSAGATVMSAFLREDRWLQRGTMLMIHCRRLAKTVQFDGPLASERRVVQALLAEIDAGIEVQIADFRRLIEGSDVTEAEVLE
jgi:hypothetical protein